MYRINKEYCNDQVTLEVSDAEECLLRARFSLLFCRNNTTVIRTKLNRIRQTLVKVFELLNTVVCY